MFTFILYYQSKKSLTDSFIVYLLSLALYFRMMMMTRGLKSFNFTPTTETVGSVVSSRPKLHQNLVLKSHRCRSGT